MMSARLKDMLKEKGTTENEGASDVDAQEKLLGQLAALCANRARTYHLISRLFAAEVDCDLLENLRSMRYPAACGNADMEAGYRLIASYLSNAWENTPMELAVDYTRLFIGHGISGHSAAYPFESAYRSNRHLLMQDARDEVLAIYRSEGFERRDSWTEGEDHAAVELEFMGVMAARTASLLEESLAVEADAALLVQLNFLDDHLERWVPQLCDEMAVLAKTDFYLGLARLTRGYLKADGEFLREVFSQD